MAKRSLNRRRHSSRRQRTLTGLQPLEARQLLASDFSLQLLHASDLEGGVDAISDAPHFAAIVESLEADAQNDGRGSLLLSAGDNFIGGPFFSASGDGDLQTPLREAAQTLFNEPGLTNIRADGGRVDISIMNILEFDASALGNHEFDFGTDTLGGLMGTDIRGASLGDVRWLGAQFPYLSANLDFSGDPNLAGLFTSEVLATTDYQADLSDLPATAAHPKIAPATIADVDGESVAIVGATTQLISQISSPGGTVSNAGNTNDMQALADVLNPVIADIVDGDDDIAGNDDDVDKVILVSHLQQISLEEELAGLLNGVDVIVAGGSDTLLADSQDTLRAGDVAEGTYPLQTSNADNDPTLIVSTDGEYSYVGRLVVDFDENGVLIPEMLDSDVSGVFATDEAGTLAVTGAADIALAIAGSSKATEVNKLVEAVRGVVTAKDSEILGVTDVFIEGRRSEVRTQETNLGNLTADANLATAQQFDSTVMVSIKNGGGIRAAIGSIDGLSGEKLPTAANPDAGKEAGEVSQLDIENALRFDNGLTVMTVTAAELKRLIEHGVAATDAAGNATPGQFPQIGGARFSFDPNRPELILDGDANVLQEGERVRSLALVNEAGETVDVLVQDGQLIGNPDREIRIVTLDFLAGIFSSSPAIGGDGYPFPAYGEDVVHLDGAGLGDGVSSVFTTGREQDALAEYLLANHNPAGGTAPYRDSETSPLQDQRIQNLALTQDTILTPSVVDSFKISVAGTFETGVFDESAAEIVAHDPQTQRVFFTNSDANEIGVLDIADPSSPIALDPITFPSGTGGVNSVAVSGGIVAVAVEAPTHTDPGGVLFYNVDGDFLGSVTVGALPDSLTFSPDGMKVVVAGEGEPDDLEDENPAIDPMGTISVIDLARLRRDGFITAFDVTTLDFTAFDGQEDDLRAAGVRIFPGRDASRDLEPEYATVSPDGTRAFVTLQEANSVAVVDLTVPAIIEIQPLGVKDHSQPGNGLDPSDRDDSIAIAPHPVFGLYMPDALTSFEVGGQTYYATANEGDSRDFDEDRIKDIDLDPVAFPNADDLQEDEVLGRLTISNIDGDIDGDGDFDQLFTYGARSFTIFDSSGNVVFDSGDQFEQLTAQLIPDLFNSSNDENEFDSRSDAKGPEPEAITTGVIGDRMYAFIGLERTGGVFVYDITSPAEATFVQYINNRDANAVDIEDAGDLGVEDLKFVSGSDSPNGQPLLLASNEVSGSVTIFQLGQSVLDVELRAVATPSVSGSTSLPDVITTSPVGGTYYVEAWVQDFDNQFSGLAGGQIDVRYNTDVTDAVAVSNEDYDLLPSGSIDDAAGLVDDLGGGTLQTGQGLAPNWVRLGYFEVVATASGTATYTLAPGSLPFARFGGGNLDIGSVDLTDVESVQHVQTAMLDLAVVRQDSVLDSEGRVPELPASAGYVHEWESFTTEVYLTPQANTQAVTAVAFDLSYNTSLTSAWAFEPAGGFTLAGTANVDDASGSVGNVSLVADDAIEAGGPILLGRVRFSPGAGDDAPVDEANNHIGPYDLGLMIQNATVTSGNLVGSPGVGQSPATGMWAVPYDADDSDRVDFADFSVFASVFGAAVTSPNSLAAWADFDGSGLVDYDDLDLFEANHELTDADGGFVQFSDQYPTPELAEDGEEIIPASVEAQARLAAFGPFTNQQASTDVNADGYVTALDALIVINALNETAGAESRAFLDVNDDGYTSAVDALRVINDLNESGVNGGAGAESIVATPSPTTTTPSAEDVDQLLGQVEEQARKQLGLATDQPIDFASLAQLELGSETEREDLEQVLESLSFDQGKLRLLS
ncbi:choice-of-anchor I family protein [Rhodopirellula sallentina]|uniref:Alkaline phosphatase n=1 Tax=Rhodopirellula sallentina SM41 TaxID=1263870 RepID=M5UN54_9BACT|nr:choice-of-anchor I family protein [Rhodopirellula sallentina]EMI57448.1 alkaline phosphatase [Rhodopirellula sallentina SM41]